MISGGYCLALSGRTLSASACISAFFPDVWAIEWTSVAAEERVRQAAAFGARKDAITWATSAFEKSFGWPNVFYTLDEAREARDFLAADVVLFGLGLDESHVDAFLHAAQPAGDRAGESGVFQCVRRGAPVLPGGEALGFELLATEHGLITCSWHCNALEQTCAERLGVDTNRNGLVSDHSAAVRCSEFISRPDTGAEPGLWLPWLLTLYPTTRSRP
jgi:hypothetical protein